MINVKNKLERICNVILEFVWRDLGNPQRTSIGITGVPVEIRTGTFRIQAGSITG
jgi:hypothetical protein